MFEGPRRVSSKVGDKFTSMKGRLLPGTTGWCSINHDGASDNEKSAPVAAANAGSLLERRLGTGTPPQRVSVNPYGMIFRKPKRDSSMSDIFVPAGQTRPLPSSAVARNPVLSSAQMAAAHLENERKRVSVSAHNHTLRTPLRGNTRMSDVSSLSSGFGDGDIVIIHPPTAAIAIKPAQPSIIDSHVNLFAARSSPERKSFSSRFSRNRDTVYTNSSEDLRPRFRPISSWVRQQSRRTKRAAASKTEDGVPNLPETLPEQGFDMMMPDDEEPRRVESAMWRGK